VSKIEIIQSNEKCLDASCVFQKLLHYHCNFSKYCHFSTNHLSQMDHHLNDFHAKMEILENYEYFDRNYDCKLAGCCYNKVNYLISFISSFSFNSFCYVFFRSHVITTAFSVNFPFQCQWR